MYEAMHIPSSTDNMAKLPTKTKNVLGEVTNCSSAWITSVSSNERALLDWNPGGPNSTIKSIGLTERFPVIDSLKYY